jgi:hypothetical protein
VSKSLVVGCSFLENLKYNNSKIKVIGIPAAGNRLISAVVSYELATNEYDKVYVLWSGISRLDVPIGIDLHNTFNSNYSYYYKLNDTVWYSSGGIQASGSTGSCPSDIKKIFYTQYLASTKKILTEWSLSSVLATQSLLEFKNIFYKMGFIYNIHNPAFAKIDWLSNVLGTVDQTATAYQLIDWSKIQIYNNPHDWATVHNMLLNDNFHPKLEGMIQWLLENFNLDVAKLVD